MSDAALIALVPLEVGDPTQATITPAVLMTLMNAYADKAGVARLQYLYSKRHALDLMLGPTWAQVNYNQQGYLSENLSDQNKALLAMRAAVQLEIEALEKTARGQRPGAVVAIAQTAPVTQTDGYAQGQAPSTQPYDANDPSLIGSPYRRAPWRP